MKILIGSIDLAAILYLHNGDNTKRLGLICSLLFGSFRNPKTLQHYLRPIAGCK